ncbi:MAG: proton-conducting transporter membrane subunit [bacterium]|nr:proton-conducting transporter membrane subunit [bacterium]
MNPNILIIPFILAFIFSVVAKNEKVARLSNLVFSLIGGSALIFYATSFLIFSQNKLISSWWRMDDFSALMVILIAIIYIFCVIISFRYIGHEYEEKIITLYQYKLYFALFQLFALCMILVIFTNNSLLLWLALEGTTLFSTFLVGLYRKKTSIEAAWKYMILCSTGISLGLVGILLLSYGAHVGGVAEGNIFLLNHLADNAQLIPKNIIKLAFIFLFIGFGTKVGLAPMHTWLPDAHSKAPSPISAIFSAVLLNVALYAILRFKFITDSAFMDASWTNNLFLIFGFCSVILAAFMMLIQTNYKRMLAYSSIEHMGIILFSLGLSPIGAVAGVMHMIGHTFAKSALFFGAGEILIRWKTTKISKIKNMFKYARYTSILFILGIVAIIAIPPSALFVSEYGMFAQAIIFHPVASLFLFIALSIIAYAMLSISIRMIFDTEEEVSENKLGKEKWNITHTIIVLEICVLIFLAFWFTTGNAMEITNNIVKDFLFIKQ